jgi:hypothetical protein
VELHGRFKQMEGRREDGEIRGVSRESESREQGVANRELGLKGVGV